MDGEQGQSQFSSYIKSSPFSEVRPSSDIATESCQVCEVIHSPALDELASSIRGIDEDKLTIQFCFTHKSLYINVHTLACVVSINYIQHSLYNIHYIIFTI